MHQLNFMGLCSDNLSYQKPSLLDNVFAEAKDAGQLEQIWEALDPSDGDRPLHKAASAGNPTALNWIF